MLVFFSWLFKTWLFVPCCKIVSVWDEAVRSGKHETLYLCNPIYHTYSTDMVCVCIYLVCSNAMCHIMMLRQKVVAAGEMLWILLSKTTKMWTNITTRLIENNITASSLSCGFISCHSFIPLQFLLSFLIQTYKLNVSIILWLILFSTLWGFQVHFNICSMLHKTWVYVV